MAKKPPIHNHIENLTVNIDYDQLAKAILAEQKKSKDNTQKRVGARHALMSWCNGIIYAALYSYVIYEIIAMWKKCAVHDGIGFYMCVFYTVAGGALAVLLFLTQQETMTDSKEDAITHFNTNIALIALIAALVAWIKG